MDHIYTASATKPCRVQPQPVLTPDIQWEMCCCIGYSCLGGVWSGTPAFFFFLGASEISRSERTSHYIACWYKGFATRAWRWEMILWLEMSVGRTWVGRGKELIGYSWGISIVLSVLSFPVGILIRLIPDRLFSRMIWGFERIRSVFIPPGGDEWRSKCTSDQT